MYTNYLYGISGADNKFRVVRYTAFEKGEFGVEAARYEAYKMKRDWPSIERVFAMDNNRTLYRDYRDAVKKDSIEGWVCFKDILERQGWEIKL